MVAVARLVVEQLHKQFKCLDQWDALGGTIYMYLPLKLNSIIFSSATKSQWTLPISPYLHFPPLIYHPHLEKTQGSEEFLRIVIHWPSTSRRMFKGTYLDDPPSLHPKGITIQNNGFIPSHLLGWTTLFVWRWFWAFFKPMVSLLEISSWWY